MGNNEPVSIVDEVPFEIPESWEWVRLSTIIELQSGQDLTSDKYNDRGEGIPYITGASNIENENVIINRWTEYGRAFAYEGDLLLTCKGTVGTMAFLKEKQVHVARQIMAIRPAPGINPLYTRIVLESLVAELKAAAKSMIPGISRENVLKALFPLPPENEQQRIIEKISEIKPLLGKYDSCSNLINQLNNSFPELLKKSILQEAVMGKLVPQDENDEPASVLLERIREEKQHLIAEGKLKKDKHESIIYRRDNSHYEKIDGKEICIDYEIPFDIPESWAWCRLSDVTYFIGGYAYKSNDFVDESEYQVLRLGNIKNDLLKLNQKPVFIKKELAELTENFHCKKNDILLTMTGTRGKRDYFFTVKINDETNMYINQRVGCLRSYIEYLSDWLIYTLKSECILSQVFEHETGTANQGNLGSESIMKTIIPLPPIEEQKRIIDTLSKVLNHTSTL